MHVKPGHRRIYGSDFPVVTVEDWVDAQARVPTGSGIPAAAVMGGSLAACRRTELVAALARAHAPCASRSPRHRTCRRRTSLNEVAARSSPTRTPRRPFLRARRRAERGWCVARMIGHITYLRRRDGGCSAAACVRPSSGYSTQGDRVRDRELPAPPGRQVQRILRRQHLPADHARARLLRPGAGVRRRPVAGARAQARPLPGGELHDRLALLAGALARDRQGAARQPAPTSATPRSMRRTATMPSC